MAITSVSKADDVGSIPASPAIFKCRDMEVIGLHRKS